jgi:Tol biopolymer transport system component
MNLQLWLKKLPVILIVLLGFSGRSDMPLASTAKVATTARTEESILFETSYYLYTINTDGVNLRRLAPTNVEVASPEWSPDGRRIAFSANLSDNEEIYVIDVDGNNLVNLTKSPENDGEPVWFPDGTKLLFIRWHNTGQSPQSYTMNADGTDQVPFAGHYRVWDYTRSPNGAWFLYSAGRQEAQELFLVSADGTTSMQLTDNHFEDYDADWSPSGGQIVFISARDGNNEVYTMNADGSNPIRLTYTPEIDEGGPGWSPDGRYIAYKILGGDFSPLYVMHPDGTNSVRIGEDAFLGDVVSYAWSPDGQYLAVSGRHEWEGYYIYIVPINCVISSIGCGRTSATNILRRDWRLLDGSNTAPESLSWKPLAESAINQ